MPSKMPQKDFNSVLNAYKHIKKLSGINTQSAATPIDITDVKL